MKRTELKKILTQMFEAFSLFNKENQATKSKIRKLKEKISTKKDTKNIDTI